jgi:tryptophan 2,3-dioxygenase
MTTQSHYNAQLDFSRDMSYGDYLALNQLLSTQHPLTSEHDEMLFIVQHQTSELWMKLALHELSAARKLIQQDQLQHAFKNTARVSRIMQQLLSAWDVLATMTPSEYTTFRAQLGHSSGFQSYQYRMIEFFCGNKREVMLKPHEHNPEVHALVAAELRTPSIYDEALRLLARRGFAINADKLERDWTKPYEADDSVQAAWLSIYQAPEQYWDLYELGEELVDLEDAFRQWRFRHLTTVERVIGFKRGTGGTDGIHYLRKMLDVVLFPELWRVRTEM